MIIKTKISWSNIIRKKLLLEKDMHLQ